jgi:hypothetical protein
MTKEDSGKMYAFLVFALLANLFALTRGMAYQAGKETGRSQVTCELKTKCPMGYPTLIDNEVCTCILPVKTK